MVIKLLFLPFFAYCIYLGIRYVFFTKTVYEKMSKTGGKLTIRKWRIDGSRNFSYLDIRFTGIILLILGLVAVYVIFFAAKAGRPAPDG
jgi:hypothetical protein